MNFDMYRLGGDGGPGARSKVRPSSSRSRYLARFETLEVRRLMSLTPIDMTNNATQGELFSGMVASFQNSNTEEPASDFSATIHWGDGTTSDGFVEGGGRGFYRVTGSHVFNEARTFNG